MKPATLKWLLVVSVAVNLFFVAAVGGAAARWLAADRSGAVAAAGDAPAPRGLRLAADELAPEQRQAFREALRDARREVQPEVRAARESRRELARVLAAPELDRAAADAAAERVRRADSAVRSRVESRVVEFASTLPPEARSRFVQGLVQRGPLRVPGAAN